MSGIAGIYYLDDRPVDSVDLAKMVDFLAHRGPDGADMWHRGPVGLGHRMLWTTPESLHEKLPLVSQSGDLVITADARIDNRAELIASLGLTARPSEEISDSQLILAAYEKWGEDCPEKLIGDFAFAIWDERKQQLFCARDHFGLKPFYYYHQTGRIFIFASEIKALLCSPEVPRQLNEVRVGDFLARNFEDKTITFYQDILRLPPAHCLTISPQRTQLRKYWEPDLNYELKLNSDEEYVEAFRALFTEAVRCRLRSAFPVGSTLSGGLDSSSIACTAASILAQNGNRRLHTLSAIFPSLAEIDPRIDERPYIEAVLASGEFEAHYIEADRLSPLVETFWQDDEVIPGINLYMDHAFAQVANQHGVRILLTGHDGDTVVSHGYERLKELARTLKWRTLFNESTALSKRFKIGRRAIIWRLGFNPLFPKAVVRRWQKWPARNQPAWDVDTAINPAFAVRIRLAERLQTLAENGSSSGYTTREAHWQAINSGVLQYATELLDKIVTPFSVEVRHPFFDKRLIELSLALPLEQKLRQGWTRAIVRHSMTDLLPQQVQWRKTKGNLSENFKAGLFEKEKKTLDRIIFENPGVIEKYVDVPVLQRVYRRYKSQPSQHERDAITVNIGVALALWLQNSRLTSACAYS